MPICKHIWPQHAHFAHGRSRITCMYMLSVFTIARDGVQSEYCRTHVSHLSGPVVLVEVKVCMVSGKNALNSSFNFQI